MILAFNVLEKSFAVVAWKLVSEGVTLTLDTREYEGVGESVPMANSQWKIAVANKCISKDVFLLISRLMRSRRSSFKITFSNWRRKVNFDPLKSVLDPSMTSWEMNCNPVGSSVPQPGKSIQEYRLWSKGHCVSINKKIHILYLLEQYKIASNISTAKETRSAFYSNLLNVLFRQESLDFDQTGLFPDYICKCSSEIARKKSR